MRSFSYRHHVLRFYEMSSLPYFTSCFLLGYRCLFFMYEWIELNQLVYLLPNYINHCFVEACLPNFSFPLIFLDLLHMGQQLQNQNRVQRDASLHLCGAGRLFYPSYFRVSGIFWCSVVIKPMFVLRNISFSHGRIKWLQQQGSCLNSLL